ncbi:metallophosphoesterase family protein [Nitriliruptoraceae bacterium ZYF776]|nr:metallophosphoesterase family protein [Profundirhabdus halotolerans]
MRLGLLADVHANLPALEAALAWTDRQDVDALVCAGDLVGYGASPDAVVERLVAADAIAVAGNHEWLLLDRLPPDGFSTAARRAAEVTGPRMGADTRAYLAALPLTRQAGPAVIAHGTLDDPNAWVDDRPSALRELAAARARFAGTHALVLGNTHHPLSVRAPAVGGRPGRVVNPGAVGQSRSRERAPRCRVAVLDTDTGAVRFARLPYDHGAARDAVRALGLTDTCVHSRPTRASAALRRLPDPVRRGVRTLRHDLLELTS